MSLADFQKCPDLAKILAKMGRILADKIVKFLEKNANFAAKNSAHFGQNFGRAGPSLETWDIYLSPSEGIFGIGQF